MHAMKKRDGGRFSIKSGNNSKDSSRCQQRLNMKSEGKHPKDKDSKLWGPTNGIMELSKICLDPTIFPGPWNLSQAT